MNGTEIAIIGMSGRFPGADDVDALWRNVEAGIEAISTFTVEQVEAAGVPGRLARRPDYVRAGGVVAGADRFDAAFFGCSPRDAELLDPQQRVFLECAWEALEAAGCASERYPGLIGVYAGAGFNHYLLRNLAGNPDVEERVGEQELRLANEKDTLATRVSYLLDLRGPALTVQTACSTSLVAVHVACQALLNGECDVALAGGVSIRAPQGTGYLFREGGVQSPDGRCRPFDARAHGTVGGAGAGVVVLRPLADAIRDRDPVRAVIRGSAINNDGATKVGFTAPSVGGQAAAIRMALRLAEVDPATVSYVETHGTGTVLGDPIEFEALRQAFAGADGGSGWCTLGTLKALIGHLDAAAGVAGLIKTVLALEHATLPPSPHFETPNPAIELEGSPFAFLREARPWARTAHPRRAGVSSFGIGGTNAHVVLEEAPARPRPPADSAGPHLLVLSARTEAALAASRDRLRAHLEAHPEAPLGDVAHTLRVGRRTFSHRLAAVGAGRAEAIEALRPGGRAWTGVQEASGRPVAFLFPGQGTQYAGMGRGLYDGEPVFREHLDRCAELLRPHLGSDLRETLYAAAGAGDREARALQHTATTQPALFAVMYALARLWRSWGVQPAAMLGHSIGEYVSACLAGTFTLEEAIEVVAARGRLMAALPEGSMLSVNLAAAELAPHLGPDVAVAADNAPRLCVASGPHGAIEALEARLRDSGVACQRLRTSHAFHSAMMDSILDEFAAVVGRIGPRPPRTPFVSNVTGRWITAEEAADPAYWARHARGTVRFREGVETLLRDGHEVVLEVGPGSALGTLARQQSVPVVVASMRSARQEQPDAEVALAALGRLWLAGATVDWEALAAPRGPARVPLPSYPFQRQRYWIDAPGSRPAAAPEARTLHERPEVSSAYEAPAGEAERRILAIWQDLLGIGEIGVRDNFFELGGHSLLATQIIARVRDELEVDLSPAAIFEAVTIADLAALVEAGRREEPADEDVMAELLAEIQALTPAEVAAELDG